MTDMIQPQATLDSCDQEQVHIPGAVQEWGAMLVIEYHSLRVLQVSQNAHIFFGAPSERLLGTVVTDSIDTSLRAAIDRKAARVSTNSWTGSLIYERDAILLEAEKNSEHSLARLEVSALDRLQAALSLSELLEETTASVATITGLDRVMLYRFHSDLHGEVVAETVQDGVESYLGLHYPASDIPLPARAIFLKNWVRMIPNVAYFPVALTPLDNPLTKRPTDLGRSLLRAVSPLHIEYLKNMRVAASLTISLIVNGKLWGLIACHHLHEYFVPASVRDACESIGRMVSALIANRMAADHRQEREKFATIHRELAKSLEVGVDIGVELTTQKPNLLDLVEGSGSAAALYLDGYWATVGATPPEFELEMIIDWLKANHARQMLYATESLAKEYPKAAEFSHQWCGMLALAIPKSTRNYILWFRPEIISTVNWAGKPEKEIDQTGKIHPRRSFDLWHEEVRGKSLPWTETEKAFALELRTTIMAVDLKAQYGKEQVARIEAERATRAREELMAVLSHDLKNPIGSIRLGAQFAKRFLNPENIGKVKDYLLRIEKTTASMDALISDILSITKLEAGHMGLETESVCISELLAEVVDLVKPIAAEKSIDLSFENQLAACDTQCDRGQMFQVFSNILGNAIKFTPDHGEIRVRLESCGPESIRISVRDTGPGIPPEDLRNIFDRFWQAKITKRLGTGLGLAIVKGIVSAHRGEVWAESDGKTGSTFYVKLPFIKTVQPPKPL